MCLASSPRRSIGPWIGGLVVLAAVLVMGACDPAPSMITVSDAVVPVPATADSAAVYLRITNSGGVDDELLNVTSPSAALTHLHRTSIDASGRTKMEAVGTLKVPAGTTVDLSPGGLHLMMMQPKPLTAGETVQLTLTFKHAGDRLVTAKVSDDISDVVGQ